MVRNIISYYNFLIFSIMYFYKLIIKFYKPILKYKVKVNFI